MKVKLYWDNRHKILRVEYMIEGESEFKEIGRFQVRGKRDFLKFIEEILKLTDGKLKVIT